MVRFVLVSVLLPAATVAACSSVVGVLFAFMVDRMERDHDRILGRYR